MNIDPSAVLMSTRPHSVGCPRRNKRYFGVIHESIDEEDYDDDTSLSISDNSNNYHKTKTLTEVKKMKLLKEIADQQYQSLPSLKTDGTYYKHISSNNLHKFYYLCLQCGKNKLRRMI